MTGRSMIDDLADDVAGRRRSHAAPKLRAALQRADWPIIQRHRLACG